MDLYNKGILLVDDEYNILNALGAILNNKGYNNIYHASNGIECLSILQEKGEDIHIIILDMVMPEMGGIQVIQHLINVHKYIVGILLISGYTFDENEFPKLSGNNIFTSKFLAKPFKSNDVSTEIEKIMNLVVEKRRSQGLFNMIDIQNKISEININMYKLDQIQNSIKDINNKIYEINDKVIILNMLPRIDKNINLILKRSPDFIKQLGLDVLKTLIIAMFVLSVLYLSLPDVLINIIKRIR